MVNSSSVVPPAASGGPQNPNLNQSQQRMQTPGSQLPSLAAAARNAGPRPGAPQQGPALYGQHQNRLPAPSNVAAQRPVSSGINFDNPSVQKALDTLIQSGPALSHLVSQTVAQGRAGAPAQQPMGSYQRHY